MQETAPLVLCYTSLERQLLAAYCALLATLCTQLRIMAWVSIAIQASLLQNGTKPGPSGIYYLQEGVASPVLDPFPDFMVLEEVPFLKPLGYQGSPLGSTK